MLRALGRFGGHEYNSICYNICNFCATHAIISAHAAVIRGNMYPNSTRMKPFKTIHICPFDNVVQKFVCHCCSQARDSPTPLGTRSCFTLRCADI